VDLTTFTEVTSAVQIFPPGQQSSSSNFSLYHIQRPGLLYDGNGYVYVAFSMMDGSGHPYPNGAIFRYNATTLAASGYFQTAQERATNSNGGGIWQGGAGLAYGVNKSGASNIYFNTGNGTFDANTGGSDYGDSFIELDPSTMTVATNTSGTQLTFTPADQYRRSNYQNCNNIGPTPADYDFGSGGVILIPPKELSAPYVAATGDKESGIWFMDMDSPGGHVNTCDGSCSCSVTQNGNAQTFPILGSSASVSPNGPVIHTNPGFWETGGGTNYLYISSQQNSNFTTSGELVQFTLCPTGLPINSTGSGCTTSSVAATDSTGTAVVFPFGTTPTISAKSSSESDAILWAIKADGSVYGGTTVGVLYAFKAVEMTYLYSSDVCSGDAMLYPATKFSIPTVANGYVYVGGQGYNSAQSSYNAGTLYIFGTLSRSC